MFVLKAKHATPGNHTWGVNGETGKLQDMTELGVWDTYSVKAQTVKTAIEVKQNHGLKGNAFRAIQL